MALNWMDTSELSFRSLLLLERVQIGWLPRQRKVGKEQNLNRDLAVALKANPGVEWFMRHKCHDISAFLDSILPLAPAISTATEVQNAEQRVLASLNDWLVYAIDPSVYDKQPFLAWDSNELLSLVDFMGKVVIDVGAGTGRLALVAAPRAKVIYAIEPVENLRLYMCKKANALGFSNVYMIDGLIAGIPFPDGFADITMGGHVLDDHVDEAARDCDEMERVTKKGGMVIHCPGNIDADNEVHRLLLERGYSSSRFEEPTDGWKRKYWKNP